MLFHQSMCYYSQVLILARHVFSSIDFLLPPFTFLSIWVKPVFYVPSYGYPGFSPCINRCFVPICSLLHTGICKRLPMLLWLWLTDWKKVRSIVSFITTYSLIIETALYVIFRERGLEAAKGWSYMVVRGLESTTFRLNRQQAWLPDRSSPDLAAISYKSVSVLSLTFKRAAYTPSFSFLFLARCFHLSPYKCVCCVYVVLLYVKDVSSHLPAPLMTSGYGIALCRLSHTKMSHSKKPWG